jgi:hypothetical protein
MTPSSSLSNFWSPGDPVVQTPFFPTYHDSSFPIPGYHRLKWSRQHEEEMKSMSNEYDQERAK